jgi:hypothetical protein
LEFQTLPAELEILDVEFAEHPYPDFETWKKIEDEETVDSNIVRIRAKIINYSAETKFRKSNSKNLKKTSRSKTAKRTFRLRQERSAKLIICGTHPVSLG